MEAARPARAHPELPGDALEGIFLEVVPADEDALALGQALEGAVEAAERLLAEESVLRRLLAPRCEIQVGAVRDNAERERRSLTVEELVEAGSAFLLGYDSGVVGLVLGVKFASAVRSGEDMRSRGCGPRRKTATVAFCCRRVPSAGSTPSRPCASPA